MGEFGTERAPALEAQEVVGRYVIQHFVAEGGMGVVYAAFDPELGRHVALKLVKKKGRSEGHLRERLLREAQALAQLSHPNVISIHDVGMHEGRVFLAMELVEGVSLRGWLEQPRTWKQTVGVLLAAGRGLAAAHSAGIVHRDFKPDNVIVGNDGRVCVLDFGLARAIDGVDTEPGASEVPASSSDPDDIATAILAAAPVVATVDGRERLEKHLTRLGTVIGTPAYMSPEHHRGEPVTSLSDQYSFCVAAWEALYRQRPFSSQGDLLAEKERQRIVGPPRRSEVPARVRRLLVRGLAPEPAARHRSMEALLAELQRSLGARRRWVVRGAVAATGAIAAAGVAAMLLRAQAAQPCSTKLAKQQLQSTWNAAYAAQLERAFAGTGRAHAAATAGRVRSALGRYSEEWAAMHADSCAATHVRREQSAELLDLRTQCLDQRRDSLRALVTLLAHAREGSTVDRSVEAALGLPAIRGCADAAALRAAVPLPAEGERRQEIEELRSKLGDVRALVSTGQYAAALPGARAVVAAARPLGYAPLLAQALHTQANLEDQLGETEQALRTAREGMLAAGESRDDALLIDALVDAMWSLTHQAKFDEALALARPVEAIIARTGSTQGTLAARATLLGVVGWLQAEQGKLEESVTTLEQSAALRAEEAGPQSWKLAVSLNNLGESLRALGKYGEAGQRFERALTITEQTLGANHPNAGAIVNNLATVREAMGRYDEARQMYERSLAIDEETFGPEHSRVAVSLLNLGSLDDSLGRPAAAIPVYERALAIQRKQLGERHPDVGMVLHNLGQALMGLGKYDAALARSREALAIFEAALGDSHVNLGPPLTGIGEALLTLQRPGEALPYYERAMAIQVKALGEDAPDLAPTLHGLGVANLRMGRATAAVGFLEREAALHAVGESEPRARAEGEFALAQALWASGGDGSARARAVTWAEEALARLGEGKPANPTAAAQVAEEIGAWLEGKAGTKKGMKGTTAEKTGQPSKGAKATRKARR